MAGASVRIFFLDNIRYLMILFVVVYHSVAAYATVVPWWFYHDASFFAANITRELLDVRVVFCVRIFRASLAAEENGI
ncbi:MAG: hypothetical protein ABSC50_14670 [Candidatus Bathyarchaeia archaeon]